MQHLEASAIKNHSRYAKPSDLKTFHPKLYNLADESSKKLRDLLIAGNWVNVCC
jgi:hypothetical protein